MKGDIITLTAEATVMLAGVYKMLRGMVDEDEANEMFANIGKSAVENYEQKNLIDLAEGLREVLEDE